MRYQLLDMFSGCGGLSWGFHEQKEQFKIIGAIDFDKHANRTYERNFGMPARSLDLGEATAEDIKKEFGVNQQQPLIIIGGPPCQGFSSHKIKDKREDVRNSLVEKYTELCIDLSADIIVIENVPDLYTQKHWCHFEPAKNRLEKNGYSVNASIVNMAEFRVPQERFRAIVIASKIGTIPVPIGQVSRNNFRTVRNAISHLPELKAGEVCQFDPMHIASKHRANTINLYKAIPKDGGSRPAGIGSERLDRAKGFFDVYGRLYWDRPAITITAQCRKPSCGRFLHPEQHRGLSVREAALLQGFPPGFIFKGPFDDKYKQIGNAVPPLFSAYLAKHIATYINGEPPKEEISRVNIDAPIGKSFSVFISLIKQGLAIDEFIQEKIYLDEIQPLLPF